MDSWNPDAMLGGSPSSTLETDTQREELGSLVNSPCWHPALCSQLGSGSSSSRQALLPGNTWNRRNSHICKPLPQMQILSKWDACWDFKPLGLGLVCCAARGNQNKNQVVGVMTFSQCFFHSIALVLVAPFGSPGGSPVSVVCESGRLVHYLARGLLDLNVFSKSYQSYHYWKVSIYAKIPGCNMLFLFSC